jgi:ubiquinone/menaquinone biosynthesis C-methylase UbiE
MLYSIDLDKTNFRGGKESAVKKQWFIISLTFLLSLSSVPLAAYENFNNTNELTETTADTEAGTCVDAGNCQFANSQDEQYRQTTELSQQINKTSDESNRQEYCQNLKMRRGAYNQVRYACFCGVTTRLIKSGRFVQNTLEAKKEELRNLDTFEKVYLYMLLEQASTLYRTHQGVKAFMRKILEIRPRMIFDYLDHQLASIAQREPLENIHNACDTLTQFGMAYLAGRSLQKFSKTPVHTTNRKLNNNEKFFTERPYAGVYGAIQHLSIYEDASRKLAEWVLRHARTGDVIIDAGGGSGFMANAIKKILEKKGIRPRDYMLMDISRKMLDQAVAYGFPESSIIESDVTNMLMPDGAVMASESADIVYSHSVLWALDRPEKFFAEVQRVLKRGGVFALSTSDKVNENIISGFLANMRRDLQEAVVKGQITEAEMQTFLDQNTQIAKVLKSPMSSEQLIEMGRQYGFEVLDSQKTYIVDLANANGVGTHKHGMFPQILFRKH